MFTSDAIAAMKAMASESKKRAALVKDATCVGGLVIVLSNPDPAIVQESLETLNLLCKCPEAPKVLRNHMGMMDQLDSIVRCESTKSTIKDLATSLKNKLMESKDTHSVPLKDLSNTSRRTSASSRNSSISSSQSKAKTIVLQLRGMYDKGDRDLCARLILKVRGVISITFDLSKKRCILRTKLDVRPETLASSVAKSMTMTAQQVVKDETGQESLVTFSNTESQQTTSGLPVEEKENPADLPDYLSDESDTSILDEQALKRPSKEDQKKSAGWFSVAANFLTNSFYW